MRRGMTLIVSFPIMLVLLALASLMLDWGLIWATRSEMRQAVDAAAMAGASGLSQDYSRAQSRVLAAINLNKVEKSYIRILPNEDIQFGVWDPTDHSFEVLTGNARSSATAVRVIGRRVASRGTGLTTILGGAVGRASVDLTIEAIATRGRVTVQTVPAGACPWLAGMPSGSIVAGEGGNPRASIRAPDYSPLRVTNIPLVANTRLHFRQTTGTTSYTDASNYGPDGQTNWIVSQNPANGINRTRAPIMALVGIFLDNRQPNTYSAAPEMDFSTPLSRDFNELRPQLKQVFYIGDGLNSQGELQKFVVPSGATRFYLGIMDENGWWWDNTGNLLSTMLDGKVQLVR